MSGAARVPRGGLVGLTPDGDVVVGGGGAGPRLWPYTQHRRLPWRSRRPQRLDPVNAVVLRAAPADVTAALGARGWERPADGATHRIWVDGAFVAMSDHTALGSRAERVHVRVFALGPHTLAAAHHEVQDVRGRHVVTSWDRARRELGEALEAAGFAPLAPSAPVTRGDLRGVPGDGRIWRWVGGGA